MPESPGSEGRPGESPAIEPQPPGGLAHGSAAPVLDLAPLEELAATVAREAEAAIDVEQKGDLAVRLALLFADLLNDPEAAQRYRNLAPAGHPLACRLLLGQALSDRDPDALERAEQALREASLPDGVRAALIREVAEAWIYRLGDAGRAAPLLKGLEDRDLFPLALALAGDWTELVAFLTEGTSGKKAKLEGKEGALAEAAHLLADRLGDTAKAVALLDKIKDSTQRAYALEHLLELSVSTEVDLVALLRAKLAAIGDDESGRGERFAATYLLAAEIERQGDPAEAAALLAKLESADGNAGGRRLVLLARRRLAIGRGKWDEAAALSRELAQDGGLAAMRAYLRRAAELYDARATDAEKSLEVYGELAVVDPDDPTIARAVERGRLRRGDFTGLASHLEATGRAAKAPPLLRRAAAVFESRLNDLDGAIRLRRDALTGADDVLGHEELARLHRKAGDRVRLGQAYRKAAQHAGDDRLAAAFLCAAGSLELALGHPREAEDAFRDAARRAPADPYARLALAALQRRASRWRELADTLAALAKIITHDALRAATLRELGRLTATRLGDAKGARAHLERALELQPQDAGALHALAELYGDAGDWAQAVKLRERAVESSGEGVRSATILLEIGDIEERYRKDDDAARKAYERALAIDDRSMEALRALAQLHRKGKRYPDLLSILRGIL